MSEFLLLAPIAFIGTLAAIVALYLKFSLRNEPNEGRMKVAFDLASTQADRLQKEADCLGIQPSDLARAALTDLLDGGDEDFRATVARVLQRKAGIYKRLA